MSWDHDGNNSGSDFVYFAGGSSGKTDGISVLFALIILGLLIGLGIWLHKRTQENDRKLLAYINAHQCKITNYIGGDKNRRAVYMCDNGEKLDFEVRKAALE
jgi:hypothetical protein